MCVVCPHTYADYTCGLEPVRVLPQVPSALPSPALPMELMSSGGVCSLRLVGVGLLIPSDGAALRHRPHSFLEPPTGLSLTPGVSVFPSLPVSASLPHPQFVLPAITSQMKHLHSYPCQDLLVGLLSDSESE